MRIVYILSKMLTLPGAYMKAFCEHLTCRILGVPVEGRDYMHFDEGFGHIEHELIESKPKSFLFCWLSGFLNAFLGIIMLIAGSIGLFVLGAGPVMLETNERSWIFYVYVIFLYLGISLFFNQCPLIEDALNLWDQLYGGDNGAKLIWKILLFIPAGIILIGSYIESFGVNILIAAGYIAVGILM